MQYFPRPEQGSFISRCCITYRQIDPHYCIYRSKIDAQGDKFKNDTPKLISLDK